MFTPKDLLNRFPVIGKPQTQYEDAVHDSFGRVTKNQTNPLLYIDGTNAGVVKTIWFTGGPGVLDYSKIGNYVIRIFTDFGTTNGIAYDTSNSTTLAPFLSCELPLSMLCFAKCGKVALDFSCGSGGIGLSPLRTPNAVIHPFVSRFYDASQKPIATITVNEIETPTDTSSVIEFQFKLPIFFTTGILIQIWDISRSEGKTVDTLASGGVISPYRWVSYELGAVPTAYVGWRLGCQTVLDQAMHLNDASFDFLNITSTKGMLLGLFVNDISIPTYNTDPTITAFSNWQSGNVKLAFKDTPSSSFESTPSFQTGALAYLFNQFIDSVASDLQLIQFAAAINPDYGCMFNGSIVDDIGAGGNPRQATSIYRFFINDPIMWQNGIKGTIMNGDYVSAQSPATLTHTMSTCALYYTYG